MTDSDMPAFDVPNAATLFDDGAASAGINISLAALQATKTYPWAKVSPKQVRVQVL